MAHRLLALGLAMVWPVMAFGQQDFRILATGGPKEFLLCRPDVHRDLKMTERQIDRARQVLRSWVTYADRHMRLRISDDFDVEKAVLELQKSLTTDQELRLEEIWLQQVDVFALANLKLQDRLAMDARQAADVEAAIDELTEALRTAAVVGKGQIDLKQTAAAKEKAKRLLEAVLTAPQLRRFENMKGRPFRRGA